MQIFDLYDMDKANLTELGLEKTENWFRSLDIPMTLTEVGIGEEHLFFATQSVA